MVADEVKIPPTGTIRAIAQRPQDGANMVEVDHCRVTPNTGLDSEDRPPGKRSVTLLSEAAWAETCAELGATLPWTTRRANFLVAGLDLASLVGHAILIGEVRVWIHGETKPCGLMDRQHLGLRAALKINGRGGVFGQVLTEGTIRISDRVVRAPAH